MAFSNINHYVPQWYQREFLPPGLREQKFFYLDLSPERVNHFNGGFHFRNECRRLRPANCFEEEHLYTFFFGENATDLVERRFFGTIDRLGSLAVDFFSNYSVCGEAGIAFNNITRYLDAQTLRTPKGLDFLKKLSRSGSHQSALDLMGILWQYHVTIWAEGVWEVLCCDESPTKFIITDNPVTTYNRSLPPDSPHCQYPFDARIELVGTQTLYPLNPNRCLVITNLEYVRNPGSNPLKIRTNPRYFGQTLFDIRKVQVGRQIPENDVININYISKNRARRYIAAPEKEWLYPERHVRAKEWNNLGDRFFLMPDPRKVSFTTGIFVGWKDGSSWGIDEYGRHPSNSNSEEKKQRDVEMESFQRAKKDWDKEFGSLSGDEMRQYHL